jgi:hypothetical protein
MKRMGCPSMLCQVAQDLTRGSRQGVDGNFIGVSEE